MPTLVLDPPPAALETLLAERARLDLDRRDEVWEGVPHVIPPPSQAPTGVGSRAIRQDLGWHGSLAITDRYLRDVAS